MTVHFTPAPAPEKCANPDTLLGQPSSSLSVQGTVIHKMDDEKWAGMLKNSLARDAENKVRRVGWKFNFPQLGPALVTS